jgi:tetratricopeptide (TPR) repeat protein
VQEKLVKDFPTNAVYRQELARYQNNLGVLYSQGDRLVQAERSYRQSVQQLEELVKASPDVAAYWQDLIESYTNLISLLTVTAASSEEVEKDWRRVVELREKLVVVYPNMAELQSELDLALGGLAGLRNVAKKSEARQLLEEAVRRQRFAVELSEKDEKLPAAEREKLVNGYADRAIALIRQVVAQGLMDADGLQKAADFEPLRSRDDFKKIMLELQKK